MKVYAITYYNGESESGISALYKDKKKAEKHFSQCVEETFEGSDADAVTVKEDIKSALKEGVWYYSGDGCGNYPYYSLSEEEVR